MSLLERFADRSAKLGVLGLGYVGLPLAVEFARKGFRTLGFEVDEQRVERLARGDSYIPDVPRRVLEPLVEAGTLQATADFDRLAEVDSVNICVPTPLRKTRDPDISYILAAVEELAGRLHPGMLVILESTTYPGTTEEVILPRLEQTGLEVGRDFYLAFSPERVDPGNKQFNTSNIPKVVGGVTPQCTEAAAALYRATLSEIVTVSSSKIAETVKLLENTFRSVNVALVNEIALMCHRMKIDVWEVIDAAATKPFGFMPFYPGPGLGGHCIPIDPFYLSWKAKMSGFEARFIELAGQVNGMMPEYVVDRIVSLLNDRGKSVKGSNILILGVAYKANVSDTRESPAVDVADLLLERGAELSYHDPHVEEAKTELTKLSSVPLDADILARQDIAVIVTGHDAIDYRLVLEHVPLVLDTRNVCRGMKADNLHRL